MKRAATENGRGVVSLNYEGSRAKGTNIGEKDAEWWDSLPVGEGPSPSAYDCLLTLEMAHSDAFCNTFYS